MWHDIKLLNATTNALLGAFALALLASGLWWVTQRPMFTLKVIRLEGADVPLRHVNPATVRGTAIPRITGNFFTANLDAVRLAFESVPLAIWGEDGRLVSVKGDVFTANMAEAEEDGELPEFSGPDGSEKEVVARFRELQEWFTPIKLTPDAVRLSRRYAWSVKLNNGISVELGREQSRTTLKERVERLVGIYPQLVARLQDRIESVDMRYPNGLALNAKGLASGLGEQAPARNKGSKKPATGPKKRSGTT